MEALRSMGQQTFHEGCHDVKNCEVCGGRLSGTAWKYCDRCREAGQRQAKRQRDKEDKADYRERNRLDYNRYHFLRYHHLTELQLKSVLDHAEPRQEYACLDDFHEDVLIKLESIRPLIIQPPADLPSAAATARKAAMKLHRSLEKKLQDSGHNFTTERLLLATKELLRDIGQWHAAKAITRISVQAKAIQELMLQQQAITGLIHALLVHVEIQRIKYFATTRQYFLDQAHNWLVGAENACDLALTRATGEQKQVLAYLRFYIDCVKIRLAFDEGEREQAVAHIQALDQRATAFMDTYGSGQMVTTVRFLTAMGRVECQRQRGDKAYASDQLREAEAIFAAMQWRSIESQHYVVAVKAELALASNNPEYPKYVQDYMAVLHRYPCFEYRRRLGTLIRAHPKELAEVTLPGDHALFVDATFTHIHPFVRYV